MNTKFNEIAQQKTISISSFDIESDYLIQLEENCCSNKFHNNYIIYEELIVRFHI